MFIEPTVLSLIVAKLRRGRYRNLKNVYIKGWYLLIIATIIQGSISIIKKINLPWGNILITEYFIYIIIITYSLMIITAVLNFNKKYMRILLIGIIFNLIVILGNGGKMPVSLDGLKGINSVTSLPDREFDIKHTGVNSDTKFIYLADIILIPRPYPLPKILSIGDIFLMVGMFMFFQEEMIKSSKKLKSQIP